MKKCAVLGLVLLLCAGCAKSGDNGNTAAVGSGQAKYVFLFIGDGMSMPQIEATEIFATARQSKDIVPTKLGFTGFPVSGLATTYDSGTFITDSASAATAIATGHKTQSGVINMDERKTQKYKPITAYVHDAGMKVGIVTSVTLNHATLAAFYASAPSRGDYYDIACQIASSGFEYFGGGTIDQRTGKNKDQRDAVEIVKAAGYAYVDTKDGFNALKPGALKVVAVTPTPQDSGAMKYDIDRAPDELSLADYTKKGIELLDNPKGFLMMIEGGKIDWACHANDAGTVIHDVLALDAAVRVARDFAAAHPSETLIVVTGDHETGGLAIGFAGTGYDTFFDKVALQKRSYIDFDSAVLGPYKLATPKATAKLADLLPAIKESFGIDLNALTVFQKEQLEFAFQRSMGNEQQRSFTEDQYLLYGGYEPLTVKLTQILNQTAGIGWTTYAHTGVPVPVFASGVDSNIFGGFYDNTDLFRKLAAVLNLKV